MGRPIGSSRSARVPDLSVRNARTKAALTCMRFYFDFQDLAGTILDDDGEELPDIAAVRDAAMRYLAKAIRDHSPSELTDKLSVHVRTKEARIMTVSATIEVVGAPTHGRSSNLS